MDNCLSPKYDKFLCFKIFICVSLCNMLCTLSIRTGCCAHCLQKWIKWAEKYGPAFWQYVKIKKTLWIHFSNWLPGANWCLLIDGLKKLKQNPNFSDWWKSGFPSIRTKQHIYCNLSVSVQLFQQGSATLEQDSVSGHQNIPSTEGKMSPSPSLNQFCHSYILSLHQRQSVLLQQGEEAQV